MSEGGQAYKKHSSRKIENNEDIHNMYFRPPKGLGTYVATHVATHVATQATPFSMVRQATGCRKRLPSNILLRFAHRTSRNWIKERLS